MNHSPKNMPRDQIDDDAGKEGEGPNGDGACDGTVPPPL